MHSAAWFYHFHHRLHTEDAAFWSSLATQQGDPILELGCGTGRVFLSLLEQGYQMYGLDIRADMLAILRAQLHFQFGARSPAPAFLWQGDMRSFRLARRFPLIILPCNTLSALSDTDRELALGCVYKHLAPGGVFAASIPNPAALAELEPQSEAEIEEVFSHPGDGDPVQVSSGWTRYEAEIEFFFYYDHLHSDGRSERYIMKTRHNLAPPAAYLEALQAAGFGAIQTYGDFDRRPFRRRSPYLLLVARRG